MKTLILGRQVTVTDDLRALITKKLAKFDKFFDDTAEATVTLRRTKIREVMEVTISNKGTLYRSEVEDVNFQSALDQCISHIERQIRKNKTRLEKRLRVGAFTQPVEPTDTVEEEGAFRIRTKSFRLKPVTVEEAILQMNLLGHTFFVFEDIDTGKTSVVYHRHEDEYGLLIPELD